MRAIIDFALSKKLNGANRAHDTMARADKGPVIPPPPLDPPLRAIADAVAAWPGVDATGHWDPFNPGQVDGVDFYVGAEELGHIHLDGSIHLATSPNLGRPLVAEGLAQTFPYAKGWVQAAATEIGVAAAIHLFRTNYEELWGINGPGQ